MESFCLFSALPNECLEILTTELAKKCIYVCLAKNIVPLKLFDSLKVLNALLWKVSLGMEERLFFKDSQFVTAPLYIAVG